MLITRLLNLLGRVGRRCDTAGPAYTAPVEIAGNIHCVREHHSLLEPGSARQERAEGAPAVATSADDDRLTRLIAPLCGARAAKLSAYVVERFGSTGAVLRAQRGTLARLLPDDPALVDLLLAIRPLLSDMLQAEMFDAPILPDNRAAVGYLQLRMAHEPAEQVRMLYLDAKNRLIAEEVVTRGSVTSAAIFPREIVRRALDHGATGLIMAHNHPSGDPQPSRSDVAGSRAVADAARLFDILLHDHIIIGRGGYCSLRAGGFL